MKPRSLPIAAAVCLVIFVKMASAQSETKPEPKAPYLAPVPEYGHWAVTFKYDEPTAVEGAAPLPVQDDLPKIIDTIRTGELRGVMITYAGRPPQQFTCQGNWVLSSTPQGAQLIAASPSRPPYAYYTSGFVMLEGVTVDPSTYKEAAVRGGSLAFHYKSGETDVWIDPATMLPVAVKRPGVEGAYQFFAPPPRPFVIPEDQDNLLKKQRDADRRIRSLR